MFSGRPRAWLVRDTTTVRVAAGVLYHAPATPAAPAAVDCHHRGRHTTHQRGRASQARNITTAPPPSQQQQQGTSKEQEEHGAAASEAGGSGRARSQWQCANKQGAIVLTKQVVEGRAAGVAAQLKNVACYLLLVVTSSHWQHTTRRTSLLA